MQLLGETHLDALSRRHQDVRGRLAAWRAEVRAAIWRTPQDIKARYPHASFLADNRVVFNIKGNHYRIDTQIAYQTQIVLVIRAGTHAEYDRWTW